MKDAVNWSCHPSEKNAWIVNCKENEKKKDEDEDEEEDDSEI